MVCARCGENCTDSDARFCPMCGASLAGRDAAGGGDVRGSEPAVPRGATEGSAPTTAQDAPARASTGPRCAEHPGASATEICARCGAFACSACARVDAAGRPLCARCHELEQREAWIVPWEERQRLGRFSAFWATARRTMFTPGSSFALVQPRTGRLWDPLSYALFANSVVMLVVTVVGAAIFAGVVAFVPDIGDTVGWIALGIVALILIALPIGVLARVFLLAGLEHLMLLLVGGARQGFEATLRAHCYSSGPTVFAIVPFCGPYVSEIWQIVLRIHGYRAVHRIPGGRAAAAVLTPIAVCLCGYMVLVATFQH